MTVSWERLAENSQGEFEAGDYERAVYRLVMEQVIYGSERGSGAAFHLIVKHLAVFKDVVGKLGLTLLHNSHQSYVVVLPNHRVGQRMRLSETRLALVLRRLYDDKIHKAEVTAGEAFIELEDLERAYRELIGKPFPDRGELSELLRTLKRYGICRQEETENELQPFQVVVRPGIVDVLGESALHQLAAHAPDGTIEEDSNEVA